MAKQPTPTRQKPRDAPVLGISRRAFLQLLQAGVIGRAAAEFGAGALAQDRFRLLDTLPLLVVTGILQPASADSVFRFMQALTEKQAGQSIGAGAPSREEVAAHLENFTARDQPLLIEVARTRGTGAFYALTAAGEAILSEGKDVGINLRRLRDSVRLYLLRGPRGGKVQGSREWVGVAVGGDTLSEELWLPINELGMGTPAFRAAAQPGRPVRSRHTMSAIFDRTEASPRSRGTPSLVTFEGPPRLLRYFSFGSFGQILQARGIGASDEFEPEDLALCFGISLTRLKWMAVRRKKGQYRTFEIEKSSGGKRVIESPRLPLMVVQRLILDFILRSPSDDGTFHDPPLSDAIHSFRTGRGPLTNALRHLGKDRIDTMDIEDFFGSINKGMVREALARLPTARDRRRAEAWNGVPLDVPLSKSARRLIAHLCTTEIEEGQGSRREQADQAPKSMRLQKTRLPQGGPTSPMLSNLVLADFDSKITDAAQALGYTFTRYADDISISGPDTELADYLLYLIRNDLRQSYRMRIKPSKTRTARKSDQQRVTGIVVNETPHPPRAVRRKIRAAFHNAQQKGKGTLKPGEYAQLHGYYGYLSMFRDTSASVSNVLPEYKKILAALERA